jgi:hypothetical protein
MPVDFSYVGQADCPDHFTPSLIITRILKLLVTNLNLLNDGEVHWHFSDLSGSDMES